MTAGLTHLLLLQLQLPVVLLLQQVLRMLV